MSLILKRKEQLMKNNSGGASYNLFYDLRINGNSDSPKMALDVVRDGKKETIHGRYETVLFLCPYDYAPVIGYHKRAKKDSKDRILSARSFEGIEDCPLDAYYRATKDMKEKPFTGMLTSLFLPVLSIRRQKDPVLYDGNPVNPVNWFELGCSSYIKEAQENLERLEEANEKYPIHQYLYKIFCKDRKEGEKGEFHFIPYTAGDGNPVKITPQVIQKIVTTNHPLISDWRDERGNFIWDDDYYAMIQAFAVLRFQRFVHPETGEVFDYGGIYQQCIDIYNEYKNDFPPPVVRTEGKSTYTQEDDLPF